ncbi:MAG: class I SAM-dependent methyltransferase [Rhodocyclaceae bacterium]|nr:class I SAM-dependent methyltransferase [Rhodocyclaceae bacterium]MBX3670667.1 class I SAM-dependent methyltransferase [Rhodocyclaceae bacterium]
MNAENPYDQQEYPGSPRPQAHPRRLRTHAWLHGHRAAELAGARVLELGCGDAQHLIWLASEFPQMRLVGVDLAESGVRRGRDIARAAGLKVELHACDLRAIDAGWGEFDYIIAHGVYSWVPPAVRDALLAVCAERLAPAGVAFVSYNTLPGGHMRRLLEDMLTYHVRDMAAPAERMLAARDFAQRLVAWSAEGEPERAVLAAECQRLLEMTPAGLYHDALADINTPLLFADFAAHAARHGLAYLAEAHFSDAERIWLNPNFADEVAQLASGRVAREQYADFARMRRFRQTLLVHADVGVSAVPLVAAVRDMAVAARLTAGEPGASGARSFSDGKNGSISIADPARAHLMEVLAQMAPARLPFADAARFTGARDEEALADLARFFLVLYSAGMAELELDRTPIACVVAERPAVTAYARWQVGQGAAVATLRGQVLEIEDALSRALIGLLDGQRDVADIAHALAAQVRTQNLPLPPALESSPDHADLEALLAARLPEKLAELARVGLLVEAGA